MKLACPPSTVLALIAAALLALPASAAVPGQVSYQGLLLDDLGSPVTATVSMTFEIFDASTGGSALWYESHPAVQVVDGVYDVVLGQITPLTQSVVAGGTLHLEVTVEGETLTPRAQLLMVPYALRAEVSESTEGVGGYDVAFVEEIIQHYNFDGGGPSNTHPSEGVDDVDGDGRANFIDPDNDGDGISDIVESGQGSDINLVTPVVVPPYGATSDGWEVETQSFTGSNFDPAMTVQVGAQSPAPYNVTPTSFQVDLGPQPPGTVAGTVTLPNGESDGFSWTFFYRTPSISALSPFEFDEGQGGVISVQGNNFHSGIAVQFGSQSPTPANVTPTSFDITVGPEPVGNVLLTVTHPNGNFATDSSFVQNSGAPRTIFVSSTLQTGALGGLAGADAVCQGLADAASLDGTYQAWLADTTDSPSTRSTQHGPYRLPNGTQVADDWSDLTDGDIDAAVTIDESGATATGGVSVWTNVAAVGAGATGSDHCVDWTSASSSDEGGRGNRSLATSVWTEIGTTIACDLPTRLYCIEQ